MWVAGGVGRRGQPAIDTATATLAAEHKQRRAVSLRARLIIGVLLLMAVALGAFSAITYVALRSFLIDRIDRQLTAAPPHLVAEICRGSLAGNPPPPLPLLVAQLDSGGQPSAPCPRAGYIRPLRLSESDARQLATRPQVPMDVEGSDGPVRAVALEHVDGSPPGAPGRGGPGSDEDGRGGQVTPGPVTRGSVSGGPLVVGLSLTEVRATLQRLLMLELFVGALALVGAGIAGAWGVRRGLQPLTRVTTTARAVAGEVSGGAAEGGGLRRRVPQGSPGTEVGQLAEAFNTMLTAVETEVAGRRDSEQRMRQFLADASHELRTPLTSLRGYAELIAMREHRDGIERDQESADALRRITHEGTRMSRLVDDLLTLARSDEGGARRDDPVALDELAANAVADVRAAYPARDISVDAEPGNVVRGDRDQLRRILVNLLVNAAVHTSGGIRVRVSRADGQVHLAVADDGPGLTPPQAAHVFDRFWRADAARTRAKGGSGLGLSIVDTLVSGHGGSIDFDTSPSAGTTVTVRLPPAP
jgi:two-component system OmpR family sensor kinase